MRFFGRFVVGFFATVGVLFLALVGLGIYAVTHLERRMDNFRAPDRFVLSINLDKGLEEEPEGRGFAALKFGSHTRFQDAVVALKRAKTDPRVVGVVASLNDQHVGMARTQELRDLIAEIRGTGKPTMLFSETMGEGTGALRAYYLASAFDDIWVQPSGTVGVAGIGVEQPFVRKMLDKLGIKPSFVQRKEYKSAPETLTAEHMSPANREAMEGLIDGWYEQIVAGVAADRKMTPEAVKALVDKGPLTAREAKDAGLVDHLGYRDEFAAALRQATNKAPRVALSRYAEMSPPAGSPAPQKSIAVITASGEIMRGGEDENPFEPGGNIRSRVTAKAIRDAAADSKVAALLIRVDSPGGSYVASDTIWREVGRAKEKKKPVIITMGDMAASGGYFIAMPADRIFASPATITGSIGTYSGKMVVSEASEKLNINWDRVTAGESAGMFSSMRDFTPPELARLNHMADVVYDDFTAKAARGRKLELPQLEKNARGRVWTGADALKVKLVDELGGFSQALDYTKTRIGLKPADPVLLVSYPEEEDSWEKLFKALSDEDTPSNVLAIAKSAVSISRMLAAMESVFTGAQAKGPQLRMEPMTVE
jgi:protease-4